MSHLNSLNPISHERDVNSMLHFNFHCLNGVGWSSPPYDFSRL